MRTLKKTLCLVLALAMMVGLCAMGANAITFDDYKDKEKVEHVEAVKVLTGMGILQGDDTGNFRASDTMNRAEGATFYTKLCATVGGGTPTFTDMAGYEWANGAVAYCEQNNIISGYGDGTFGPANPITYVQWFKMGLVAVGYDPIREGLVGDQWEINTMKLVNAKNLAAGIYATDWTNPITRDDAAQYGLNVLQATMVEYKGGTDISVNTGDTNVEVKDNIKPTNVENKSYDYRGTPGYGYADNYMQFIENFFPTTKLAYKGDLFANPTHNWFAGNTRSDNTWSATKQFAVEESNGTMVTYTTPATVTLATVFADSGLGAAAPIVVKENGEEDSAYWTTLDASPVKTTKLTNYAGTTVKLIDANEDGAADYATAKYAYPAVVASVTEAAKSSTGYRTLNLHVYNKADGSYTTATAISGSFAKYDVVLAYPAGAIAKTKDASSLTILEVAEPETAKGSLTKVTSNVSFTVDGVAYPFAAATFATMGLDGNTVAASSPKLPATYTLYLSNGCVVGLAGEKASYTQYVFAVNSAKDTSTNVTIPDSTTEAYKVGVVKQDGTTEVMTALVSAAPAQSWYTAVTSDGITTFYAPAAPATEVDVELTNGNTFRKDTPTIANAGGYKLTADANTVFVFYTGEGGYKVYNGLNNLPSYTIGNTTKAYGLVVSGIAKAIFIDLSKSEETGATSEMVYVLSSAVASTSYDSTAKKNIYGYTAFAGGEKTTVESTLSSVPGTGLYKVSRDTNGYVKKFETTSYAQFAASDVTVSGWTLIVNGTAYATNAETVIYYYDAANKGDTIAEAGAVAELSGKTGNMVLVPVSTVDNTLKAVYLVK